MSTKSHWWFLCVLLKSDGEEFVLRPLQRHATRQWALDALLKLHRDAPQEGPYAIVEVDEKPSWDIASYGARKAAPAAAP